MGARFTIAAAAVLLAAAAPAAASNWGGFNGVLRLAFDEADSLCQVRTAEPDSSGLVFVDVYAVLEEVFPVSYDGEGFMGVGGFELKLEIEGGGQVVAQDIPGKSVNLAKTQGEIMAGVYPSIDLVRGRATLAHWRVLFVGRPKDAVFRLAEGWPPSCETVEGCPGTGTAIFFVGSPDANLTGLSFSAAWSPAYLNWTGEPDTSPRGGKPGWNETGLFGAE